jgi:uncharacterized protein
MGAATVDDELLKYITDTIVDNFHPRRIILFGSRARGEARPDSDVDLLLEMETDKGYYDRKQAVRAAFQRPNLEMDLIVLTPDELRKRSAFLGGLVRTAVREGRVLYGDLDVAKNLDQALSPMADAKEWTNYAEEDLRAMQTLFASPEPTFGLVCFLAQQASEKYLQAFLVSHGMDPPRVHDLDDLRKQASEKDPSLDALEPECVRLKEYAVDPRYPMEKLPGAEKAGVAVEDAQKIRQEIRRRLGM